MSEDEVGALFKYIAKSKNTVGVTLSI
jgi:hypothetical protein